MTVLRESNLTFTFRSGWQVEKYDTWPIYLNQIKDSCGGLKGVDFIALDPHGTLWLIEVKDYRRNRRIKKISIWNEMSLKTVHTLAGFVIATQHANHPHTQFAQNCLCVNRIRVVLHLEQPQKPSKLFPRPYDLANIQLKLKQMVKPIDAHPRVVEMADLSGISWTVV